MIKKIVVAFLFLFVTQNFAQRMYPYEVNLNLFPASPGALRFGLNGFDNPALLNYIKNPDFYFIWNNGNKNYFNLNEYGFFAGFNKFGFSYYNKEITPTGRINSYKFSSAFGDRFVSFGFSYQWTKAKNINQKFDDVLTLASLMRLNKFLSIGLIGSSNYSLKNYETALDFSVRPFGTEKITLFTDYVYWKFSNQQKSSWSGGIVVQPFSGMNLSGRYFDNGSFSFGLQVSFGNIGFLQSINFNKTGDLANQIQGIRFGSYDKNIFSDLFKKEKTHQIDLNGQIKYQKYQLFDNSKTLMGLLQKLENIKNDKSITQIEINTSGMVASRVFLWELREKLNELRKEGKKIIVYIDNANIDIYHFASVANKIVMDPMGIITLEGVLMGRNFYKGTLEKIGLGFDELRFFKYKSAAETYSRDKMSYADREQRDLIVENLYSTFKADIENSRTNLKIPFDTLVNNFLIFTSKQAMEFGLVDTLGRWYEIKNKPNKLEIIRVIRDNRIEAEYANDFSWGEKPKIAVIYILGACAMDEGIKARTLIKDIEKVTKDESIKAVVLRIDSPGGDALASDVIAEGIKKLKKEKPVIVSQGIVAGSGGYWLSMYADTIVSNKNTITGSIGVIGSWIYNKGFKESVGVTTDYVKRGEHADLGFGVFIPILNVVIPDRKLTNEERSKLEEMIKEMYQKFVSKVANGRNKSFDEIEKVAQGRVWSGVDAIKLGLVDVLGGLTDAIEIARVKAKLDKNDFQIVEFPKAQLLDLSSILPLPITAKVESIPLIDYLKLQLKYNGKPMYLMPSESIPDDYFIYDFYK